MKLGERQTLTIDRFREFGAYLTDGTQSVLLPKKEVPEGAKTGDAVEVFLYKDSSDRLIATVRQPYLTLHQVGLLKVRETGRIGAFLDWGLEKDLFLPFKEQTCKVEAGKTYLVSLYIDKSNRLAATMKVHQFLKSANKYQKDDNVSGIIYELSGNLGAFVAVENEYYGLVPNKEIHQKLEVGDLVNARVTDVRTDGKLNLSLNKKAYMQMDEDCVKILKVIEEYEGVLPYGEKVSPEIIARDFGLSKNAFKRALGRLYKARKIDIEEKCIRIIR